MRSPEFVGIGCRRCASSWVHNYLFNHPQVGKHRGGLHFFSNSFDKGFDWYLNSLSDYKENKILLEYSVSYSYPEHYKVVAKRIAKYLPDTKLFMTVRNPIGRAHSDYLRSIRRGEYPVELKFEDAIIKYPELIQRGMYSKILKAYLEFYPKENIKVFFYFDLKKSEKKYTENLCSFLNIDAIEPVKEESTVPKKGRAIKSKTYNNIVLASKKTFDATANFFGIQKHWANFKKSNQKSYQKALALNSTKGETIKEETKKQLIDIYKQDILAFQELTNTNLESWLK